MRLNALLNVVVHESRFATNPDALVDYLELTEILTNLLDEARLYGVLAPEELQLREQEVLRYVDKVRTVQDAVGDWDARTKLSVPVSVPVSRKRARSDGSMADDTMNAFKRQRESGSGLDFVGNSAVPSPVPSILPTIEESPTPWWMEPFCD